ncbi:helix-turn-helix domain-containing protein [Gluconacetobacter takamatsuzukensis]|uniref:Helix-turn-helix transcriptional regulator n=1 Tax=Gluconacetobacter takamatsuzukensis TaxID=1286190 RepID=A0A7W4KEF6_9PROT|nr:helix-turn-helix transcriptional regulator [Gluconacetobacter takamatsuzukensis]MBB2205459.1 helix-turn-helix transcriptional regulator [Gluconacetobacter takamatsuzukensis]
MSKRLISQIFQQRVLALIQASSRSRSAFAEEIGIDRSALSQLLAEDAVRLPRADTLVRIARRYNVSVDWLLGLAERADATGGRTTEVADNPDYYNIPLLTRWHTEAEGMKIRYVPYRLPDILRMSEIVAWELGPDHDDPEAIETIVGNLNYNRGPGTDMEICLATQTVTSLIDGVFPWDGLPVSVRRAQIEHMAERVEALYPSLRIFLFDGRRHHTVPYTIFGTQRAAIYAGSQYIVFNDQATILRMQRHFDSLIRQSVTQPHDVSRWLRQAATAIGNR